MNLLIPLIAAILFRLGGWEKGNKWFRWAGIGLFIAAIYAITRKSWMPLLLIPAYFIATNVVNYGESQVWRKWFGRDGCWLFYGASFGFASWPVLGWRAIFQGMIGAIAFWVLMKWSNDGWTLEPADPEYGRIGRIWKLDHKWVEIGIGFLGTIFYVFMK